MLVVEKLNMSFGKHQVLKDVSFTLEAREILGFIGPNGSGKSTTMKCIANLYFPDSGKVVIAGHDLSKERGKALSLLSVLIEAPGLYANLTGRENLRVFAGLRGISRSRIEEVADFTALGRALKKKTGSYSMGMKQRLALGIAILPKPKFLILDEPFSGLDPQGVFELRELIKQLGQEGCGILFSSHQLLEMEKISTRNIFIRNGEIVTQEQAQESVMALSYILSLDRKEDDPALLGKLKAEGKLADFTLGETDILITLADIAHFNRVITAILSDGRQLRGVVPQSANIENLYSHIYSQGEIV